MSESSQTRTTPLTVSKPKSSKSNSTTKESATSGALTHDSWPWDVSRTETECEICTQYPEIAWSVQQLCQKHWPTCYEELQITRLTGGSYNRIFALTFQPSAAIRPSLLHPFPSHQSCDAKRKFLADHEDTPSGDYILRVSRWNFSEIEPQMEILSYVREHTDIPVPRVLAYDTGSDNDLELPYTLQTRIPGVPLNKILKSLTYRQRLDLVHEIATIILKQQKVERSVAGRIGYPKSTSTINTPGSSTATEGEKPSSGEKLAVVTTTSAPTADEGGTANVLQVLHFDLPAWPSDKDAYNGTVNTIESSDARESVLTFLNFQFTRHILHAIQHARAGLRNTLLLHRLMRVAIEMDDELGLGADTFNLFHGDLEPRNIIVQICDFEKLHVSGIVDWDLAAFVPRAVSCLAPRWLWAPDVDLNATEREDEADPTEPESKALKEVFDDLMGEDYAEMAYEPEFAVLRRLFRLAVNGLITSENYREAEDIIATWSRMKAKLEAERSSE